MLVREGSGQRTGGYCGEVGQQRIPPLERGPRAVGPRAEQLRLLRLHSVYTPRSAERTASLLGRAGELVEGVV